MTSNQNDQTGTKGTPDAMNQPIFKMMTNESNGGPHTTSRQISSLFSQSYRSTPQHHKTQTINTGIPPNLKYMPYPIPWRAVAGPDEMPPDFSWLTDSCAGKAAIGTIGGAGVGLIMGVFLGAMSDMTPPVTIVNGREVPQAPLREQMRTTLRATGEKSLYWARNFAFITGVFGGSDCLVEKYRGTHDVWNEVISGCVTGAAMQAKQGPQAAAIGCGGFAAFSLIIDKVMH
jgi:import inner membrane translocase subunit TIM22